MKDFLEVIITILIAMIVFLVIVEGVILIFKGANKTIEINKDRFMKIQEWNNNFTFYDKETRVQYYFANGGITVLVDADGKPLLYEED